MTDVRHKGIRMGVGKPGRNRPILLIGGAAVLLVIGGALIIWASDGEAPAPTVGCAGDEACGPGKICLKGGCMPLLASEHPGIWHDEVKAQLDVKGSWRPRKSFGEKLTAASRCPAPAGGVTLPALDEMRIAAEVHLFEVGPTEITWYQFLKVKGHVWIDALRFFFTGAEKMEVRNMCASDEVARISTGLDAQKGPYVDVSLAQAAPAGVNAKAAVSWRHPAPKPDQAGKRRFTFALEPVIGEEKRLRTVLALPLGSDIMSINGPRPTEQRLQRGFVTYYWAHTPQAHEVSVDYKTPAATPSPLDIRVIDP